MKLYGALASPYVARVVMFVKIKGLDLPLSEPPGGGIKSPEYLALNPIGKMPGFEVNGQGLAESSVICDYLEDAFPQKPGLPADPLDRAKSRLISRIVDLYVSPQSGPLFRQMNPATRDQAVVDAAAAELAKAFGYISHFMGKGPFCVADAPTLGDCALATHLVFLEKSVFNVFPSIQDPRKSGRLQTWWQAIESHADCKAVVDAYAEAVSGFMKMMSARRG